MSFLPARNVNEITALGKEMTNEQNPFKIGLVIINLPKIII